MTMKEIIPYNEIFKEFLYRAKKLAASSVAAYARDADEFAAFLAERGIPAPSESLQADIAAYLLRLKREGRSSATISRKMASIRAFYRYMFLEGHCKENPALEVKLPRVARKDI